MNFPRVTFCVALTAVMVTACLSDDALNDISLLLTMFADILASAAAENNRREECAEQKRSGTARRKLSLNT